MPFKSTLSLPNDPFADGPSRKLSDDDWQINKNWEWTWHKVLDVENCMFAPEIGDWGNLVEGSIELNAYI
ncbi:MAG: hypothetical protein AB8B56_19970 [Crocinitomicaceae bacterium]